METRYSNSYITFCHPFFVLLSLVGLLLQLFYNLVLKWCFVCILIKSETGRQIRNLRKNRRRKKYLQFALQQFFPELQTLKFRDTQDKREKGTKVEHAFLNLSIFHGHVAPAYRRTPTPPHMPCTMGAAPFMKSSSFLPFLSELLENSDLKNTVNFYRTIIRRLWVNPL